jgi:tRNA nucleotidyltransferase (CCA-adding enzyme)
MKRNQPETLISRAKTEETETDLSAEYFADGYPKSEQFLEVLERNSPELIETYRAVLKICEACREEGGQALLVGGSVRDYYFGVVPKDYDIEVYRLELPKIKEIISEFGTIKVTGKAFGVLTLVLPNGDSCDVSLPRKDNKIGIGHKDFETQTDPNMSTKEAARRRDFTINSLAANPLTGEVYNHFDGLNDIRDRVLRVTDEVKFKEDALRVLRGVQFIARMGLTMDDTARRVMMETVPDMGHLPKDRFKTEWTKLFMKGARPSQGLIAAKELGVLRQWYPDLEILSEIPQEPDWHPEGDVWMHTLMAVDALSEQLSLFGLNDNERLNVLLATVCHDLGKTSTTEYTIKTNEAGEEKQRIISHGHEEAGVEPTERVLSSMGFDQNNEEFQKILKLVKEHLAPTMYYLLSLDKKNPANKKMDGVIRRLAKRIYPATIKELVAVATADHLGRGPFMEENGQTLFNLFEAGQWLIERSQSLGVQKEKPKRAVSGSKLEEKGFKGGGNSRRFGQIMKLADDLRDDLNFTEADILDEILKIKPEGINGPQDEEEVIAALEKLLQK